MENVDMLPTPVFTKSLVNVAEDKITPPFYTVSFSFALNAYTATSSQGDSVGVDPDPVVALQNLIEMIFNL